MRCSYKADTYLRKTLPAPDDYQCLRDKGHSPPHARYNEDTYKWEHYQEWFDSATMLFDTPGLDTDVSLVYHESWSQFGDEYKPGGYN